MDFREIVPLLEQEHAARLVEIDQLKQEAKKREQRIAEMRLHHDVEAAASKFFDHYEQDYHVQPGYGIGQTYFECHNIELHHEFLRALYTAWKLHRGT